MRTIKFRAWNKEQKVMVEPDCFSYDWLKHPSLFEVMQFTGLLDKNGVEIYEGDIVKAPYDDLTKYKEIIWEHGAFRYKRGENWYLISTFHEEDLEVIGNKYENPELLK